MKITGFSLSVSTFIAEFVNCKGPLKFQYDFINNYLNRGLNRTYSFRSNPVNEDQGNTRSQTADEDQNSPSDTNPEFNWSDEEIGTSTDGNQTGER